MKRIDYGFLFAVLCTLVVSPAYPGQTHDVMFQANPRHTGLVDVKPLMRFTTVKFAFRTNGPVRSTAALAGGFIYFGSGDGSLYAVNASSGRLRWQFKTQGAVHSSPAVANGIVYCTSRDRVLYAVLAATGKEVWKFRMANDLAYRNGFDYYLSSPTIVNRSLFVGSGDGHVYAFEARTGKLLWKFDSGSRIRSTPAVADNVVLVGTMSGALLALNRETGMVKWKYETQGASLKIEDFGFDRSAIVSSPSVSDGVVTFGCRDGILYALDLETGKMRWTLDHKISWVLSTPAVADGKVFAGSSDAQFLQCVDQNSGKEEWRVKTNGPIWSSPAIAGPLVYFGSNDGYLFALDKRSGAFRWRFKTNDRIFSSPVASDSTVYVGSDDGTLYALTGSTRPDTTLAPPRKVVFWDSKPGNAPGWFTAGTDVWIRDFFQGEGYAVVDSKGLEQFMTEQLSPNRHSVVIFAEHRVPSSVVKEGSENALIRRYLNAGGKIVWLGPDPLAWQRDSVGSMKGIDYSVSGKILTIQYPGTSLEGIGWYGASVTEEGKKWGLSGWGVSLGWVNPAQVSTVLAIDENGKASEWVRNYGGPAGTGLVQLWLPRDRHVDLYPVKRAAEYGIE